MRKPHTIFTDRGGKAVASVVYQTPLSVGYDKDGKVVVTKL